MPDPFNIDNLSSGKQLQLLREVALTSDDPDVLQQLSTAPNMAVRRNVAFNLNTPITTLQQLAIDKDAKVRWEVVLNVNTLASTLRQLVTDKDANVSWQATNRLQARRGR